MTVPSTPPTLSPSAVPTRSPTRSPTASPTASPTDAPTISPTLSPTAAPSMCTPKALVQLPFTRPPGTREFNGIAIAGDTLVVGGSSAVDVYSRESSETSGWILLQQLIINLTPETHIAMDGDILLIGKPDMMFVDTAAYMYTRQAGHWTETLKLTAADDADNYERHTFGSSVAIHGDTLVVGSTRVYVYSLEGGTVVDTNMIVEPDGASWPPASIAVSPTLIAVGTAREWGQRPGVVFVYTLDTFGGWTVAQMLQSPDENDAFGFSVVASVDGTVVVGAPDAGSNEGKVYVFSCTIFGECTETAVLRPNEMDGMSEDHFGYSVATSGNTIVVGGIPTRAWSKSGSVYIFTRQPAGEWVQTDKIVSNNGAEEEKLGHSVAVSTHTVAAIAKGGLGQGDSVAYTQEVCVK